MARIKFNELTKAEQRVVIAKDLIARLQTGKFHPSPGIYLSVWDDYDDDPDAQVQTVLKGKECEGCQLGGMFLCAVDHYNRLKVGDTNLEHMDRLDASAYLKRWFDMATLIEIEAAFEGWDDGEDSGNKGDYTAWACDRDPEERMILIAKNIIKNKGRFVGNQLV